MTPPQSRRAVLAGGASACAALLAGSADAQAPAPRYDLVIRGGEVLDPSQNLRARRDVGIRNALVAAVEPEIPAARGAAGDRRGRQAGLPRARRSARACLSGGLGHRPAGRRAGALDRDHHLCQRRRRGRAHLLAVPPRRGGAGADAVVRLRPRLHDRPRRLSGGRDAEHRLRGGGGGGEDGRGEPGHLPRREGADQRRCGGRQRAGAAPARRSARPRWRGPGRR